jgi:DNA-binding transcriptional LysR family regulator
LESIRGQPGSVADGHLRQSGLDPEELSKAVILGSTKAVKAAVAAGAGIAMVSRLSLRDGDSGLVVLPLEWLPLKRSFYIIWHRQGHSSRAASAFIASAFIKCLVAMNN